MGKYLLVDPMTKKTVLLVENQGEFPELRDCSEQIPGLMIDFITDSPTPILSDRIHVHNGLVSDLFNIPTRCLDWKPSKVRKHVDKQLLLSVKNSILVMSGRLVFKRTIYDIIGKDHSINPVSRMIWKELEYVDDAYVDRVYQMYVGILMDLLPTLRKFLDQDPAVISHEVVAEREKSLVYAEKVFSMLFVLAKILRKGTLSKLIVVYMDNVIVLDLYQQLLELGFRDDL